MSLAVAKQAPVLLLILFFWLPTHRAVAQDAGDPSAPPSDTIRAREMIRGIKEACRSDRALHGAWFFYDEVSSEVTFVVDRGRAAEQSKRLDELFATMPAAFRPKRKAILQLPLSDLLAKLRPRVEARLGKRGRFVQGAYFAPASPDDEEGDILLSLFGRVPNQDAERDAILDECSQLMDKDPVWNAVAGRAIIADTREISKRAASQRMIEAQDRIFAALRTEEKLHGIWVDLAECFDHQESFVYYDVITWLDAAKSQAQRSDIRMVLDEVIGKDYDVIHEISLPVSKALADASFVIDANAVFDGCLIHNAYFAPGSLDAGEVGSVELVPYGRIAGEDQRDKVFRLFDKLLAGGDRRWSELGVVSSARADGPLAIVHPSVHRGGMLYSDALSHYWNCRYDQAEQVFRDAIVERPNSLGLRYWRSLALLNLDREQDAYRQMLAVAHRRPSEFSLRSVDRSLARVQGSIRTELRRLESLANREFYIGHPQRLQRLAEQRREATARAEAAIMASLSR